MFTLFKNIIRRRQKLDIPNFQARLLEHFARSRVSKGFAVLEVASRELQGACAVAACALAHDDVASCVVNDDAYADFGAKCFCHCDFG
jgi:hypothetical protein